MIHYCIGVVGMRRRVGDEAIAVNPLHSSLFSVTLWVFSRTLGTSHSFLASSFVLVNHLGTHWSLVKSKYLVLVKVVNFLFYWFS